MGVSEAGYIALSSPQAVLGGWRVEDRYRDILNPFLEPRRRVGLVFDSQRLPVDGGRLFRFQGLEVVFGQTSVDALLHFHGVPDFGGVFMKRHDGLLLHVKSERQIKDETFSIKRK